MKRLIIGGLAALATTVVLATPAGGVPFNDGEGICEPVTPTEISVAINQSFTGGQYVYNIQSVVGPNGFHEFVGGDIWAGRMSMAHLVASDQVWVVEDGTVYAVTDKARDWSTLPDGRAFGDSDHVTYVIECVQAYRGPSDYRP